MKLGVVTIYNGANFGAYLQAYALKKYLEEKGHRVEHLKINSENRVYFYRYISKRWLKGIKYAFNYLCYGKKKYKCFQKGWKEFNVSEPNEKFDAVILGSDEIWNAGNSAFKNPLFYGVGANSNKIISYAASVGAYKMDNIPDYVPKAIDDLYAIMVRDDVTKEYAQKYTKKEVNIVCDPTLLYDFENKELPKCNDEYIHKNKYILIYAYRYSDVEKQWIKNYARENDLKIVTTGFYESWCDYCVNCEPLAFMDVIKNAELVYTSSFHCGIFSIYNNKKMVVRKSGQKVVDLFNRIGASQVLISDNDSYDVFKNIAQSSMDFENIRNNIKKFREESADLLNKALELK